MWIQGELSEAVKTLDLGVQAAQVEYDAASQAASHIISARLVAKPEPKSANPAKAVGKLKNSAVMQRLQAQKETSASPGASETAVPEPKSR